MRGLKLLMIRVIRSLLLVASFTDAWIETSVDSTTIFQPQVASFTDAWIETTQGNAGKH